MTMLDPKAVEAAAKAIRSDIWEIEPNPTTERYVAGLRQEAMVQAEAAITAYLSTITPAEVGGLVAELRDEDFRHEMQHLRSSSEIDRLFQAAASLIQSQAARIAERDELIAAFVHANDEGSGLIDCIDISGERYTSAGLIRAVRSARALPSKEGRG